MNYRTLTLLDIAVTLIIVKAIWLFPIQIMAPDIYNNYLIMNKSGSVIMPLLVSIYFCYGSLISVKLWQNKIGKNRPYKILKALTYKKIILVPFLPFLVDYKQIMEQ